MDVRFSLGASSERLGDYVIKRGKIFQAGDYPDKNFSLTREEMLDAISAFQPVDIDNEHRPSLFDGKMGQLYHVEADGDNLIGAVAIPVWMDEAIGDKPITVSTEWDRKRLKKLALAVTPRVSDAAMLSAYTAFSNQKVIEKEKTPMSRLAEWWNSLGAEQKSQATPEQLLAQFSQDTHNQDPAPPPSTPPPTSPAPAPSPAPSPSPNPSALELEVATLKAQNSQFAAERRETKARDFVNSQIRAAHILPANQEAAVALFSRAMQDDEEKPQTVKFSKGDETVELTRTELVKSFVESLPKHNLFTDHSITDIEGGTVLMSAIASGNQKSAFDEGLAFAKAWSERNTPSDSNNGHAK